MVGQTRTGIVATFALMRRFGLWLARTIAGAIWLAAVVAALLVIALQGVFWLKTAQWPDWTLADGLSWARIQTPVFLWRGLQKIAAIAIGMPLSIGVLVLGALSGNLVWRIAKLLLGRRHGAR